MGKQVYRSRRKEILLGQGATKISYRGITRRMAAIAKLLTKSELLIYLALVERLGSNDRCWPTISRLVKDTDLSRRAVVYAIDKLEASGFLRRLPKFKATRFGRQNGYELLPLDAILETPLQGGNTSAKECTNSSAKECTRNGLWKFNPSAGLPGVSLPGVEPAEVPAVQIRKNTERTGKGKTADPRFSILNNTSSDGGDALTPAQPGPGGTRNDGSDGFDDDEVPPPAPAGARDGGDACDGSDGDGSDGCEGEIQSIAAGIVAAWQAAGRRCDAATEVAVGDEDGRLDQPAEQRGREVSEPVFSVHQALVSQDDPGQNPVGEGVQARRLLGKQVLEQAQNEAAEQGGDSGRVDGDEDRRDEDEVGRCATPGEEAAQAHLQGEGDVGQDDVGEPAQRFGRSLGPRAAGRYWPVMTITSRSCSRLDRGRTAISTNRGFFRCGAMDSMRPMG